MPRPQTATSDSSPPGEDRAVATTDQPAEIGPFVVTKGQMLTGPQFYARQEERRGTRLLLDDALSWALWVNRDRLGPMAGALFDAYRALVVKALDNDPLGILPASPEVEEACRWLNEIGKTARTQAETMRHAEVETAARIKAEKERAASEIETARAQAQRVAAEKEAARVEAEKKARDLVAARDEAKRAAALAEAEKAAAIAEAERAAQAEADRVAQVKAWGSQGGGERAELTKSGVEKLKAFWAGQGWKLDEYKPNDTGNKTKIEKAAKELNVSTSTIRRWLRFMFPEKTRKRQRRPRSSAAPK